jgi:ribosomal protein S8
MNASIKVASQFCKVPVNKLCLNTLRLFRDLGYIWGFTLDTPGVRIAKLYPRVKIFFKYADANTPILKKIRIFKITRSHFTKMHSKNLYKILSQNKLYLISTPNGLVITTLGNFYVSKGAHEKTIHNGKILAEIFI